jgi:hypothetical protein
MSDEITAVLIVVSSLSFVTLWVWMALRHRKQTKLAPDAFLAVEQRLARLEVAVDDMSAVLGNVAEGQQFVTKVLVERSGVHRDA